MSKQLNLYSTSLCHLCELAHTIVLKARTNSTINIIEIAYDNKLLSDYGLRIPVLQRQDTLAELDWPFTAADIHQLLI